MALENDGATYMDSWKNDVAPISKFSAESASAARLGENAFAQSTGKANDFLPAISLTGDLGSSQGGANNNLKIAQTQFRPDNYTNQGPLDLLKPPEAPRRLEFNRSQETLRAQETIKTPEPKRFDEPHRAHMSPVDGREVREYLANPTRPDAKNPENLPQIAQDFKKLGLASIAKEDAADKMKPQVYVSKQAGDSRFPQGSKENPYQTIQNAVDKAPDGSVINVESGIYREKVKIDRSNLVLKTDANKPAVIEPGSGATGRGEAGISVGSNTQDIAIKNFEVRNFSGREAGIMVDGKNISNITIANNNVHGADGSEGIRVYGRGNSEADSVRGVKLISNSVHDLKLGELEAMPINGNVKDFTVRGNAGYKLNNLFIDAIGGEGKSGNAKLDQPRGGLIEYNYADSISSRGNKSYDYKPAAAGIYIDGARDIDVRYNYIKGSDFGLEIASEHSGLNATKIHAYGNIVEDSYLSWLTRGGEKARPGGASHSSARDNITIGNNKVQTQQNVDKNTFPVSDNAGFDNLAGVNRLPAPLAEMMRRRTR